MATKVRVTRLESEIEKCRGDANWSKVLDLARQLSTKTTHFETLSKFIQAESKLERFLLENPPTDDNITILQNSDELRKLQRELTDILNSDPKPEMRQDLTALLAKIKFAHGDFQGALSNFSDIGLERISLDNVSLRKLKIVAEAFAIKGLCLEKLPPISSSRYKHAEREEQIISCFERSGDLSLFQLQERQDKRSKSAGTSTMAVQAGGQWSAVESDSIGVGHVVEMAIQRSPILYIRNGELSKGIGRFRELLRAVETRGIQGLRQVVARQLAEVLLRGVCPSSYSPLTRGSSLNNSPTMIKQHKPRTYSSDNLFTPKDENEETLLLLLISESIATREAVLNRSPDLDEVRLHTFHNTTAVYDLLTIALVKHAQFNMLSETFERAMKFSFDEFHIWYQFALSLICSEKYVRAFLVLKECMRLDSTNPVVYLQATRLCYDHLHMIQEGLEYAKMIPEKCSDSLLLARAHMAVGIGHSLLSNECRLLSERQAHQRKAVEAFNKSVSMDQNDYLGRYHLALQLAQQRQIPEAMKHARESLHLCGDYLHSLHLLVLLLSANKQYEEALNLIEATVKEYPDNFSLLFTRCRLEELVYGPDAALQTCRSMLKLWQKLYQAITEDDPRGTGLLQRVTNDHRSLLQLQLAELSDRDSGSIRAESIAASRVEQALSEVASSMNSSLHPKQGPQQTWTLQAQIWLLLAEFYVSVGKLECAHLSIQEAATVCPISHTLAHMRGRLHEEKGELAEAKKCYESAMSIHPAHIKSLQHMGRVFLRLTNPRMAEKVLRDAVNLDPTSSNTWHMLGEALESLEDNEASAQCLTTAVQLECTEPVIPFSVLPKVMQ